MAIQDPKDQKRPSPGVRLLVLVWLVLMCWLTLVGLAIFLVHGYV